MSDRITFTDGELDAIVLSDVSIHLERMDDGHVWMSLKNSDGDTLHVHLTTRRNAYIIGRCEPHPWAWAGVERQGEDSDEPWKPSTRTG